MTFQSWVQHSNTGFYPCLCTHMRDNQDQPRCLHSCKHCQYVPTFFTQVINYQGTKSDGKQFTSSKDANSVDVKSTHLISGFKPSLQP